MTLAGIAWWRERSIQSKWRRLKRFDGSVSSFRLATYSVYLVEDESSTIYLA